MRNSFLGTPMNNRRETVMLIFISLQAIFIGAFFSLFNIGTHVLFLQSYDPLKIPQAYIISGIFGIVLFFIYSYFANRINFRHFIFWSLSLLLASNICLFIFYNDFGSARVLGIPLMLPFTLAIPFSFLVMVLFRRLITNIFTPEQHRRCYPIIRTAMVAGIVGASYALIGALYIHWDILLITAGSALFLSLATFLQLFVNFYHRHAGAFPQPPKRIAPLRSRFYEMFYTRYTFLLAAFVIISSLLGFVIHFYFISETRFNYPNTIGLAKLFGFFIGTMFLFIYGVERFLVRKILYSYDSPYSLVLIPYCLLTDWPVQCDCTLFIRIPNGCHA